MSSLIICSVGIINIEKAIYKHWMVQALRAERRILEVTNVLQGYLKEAHIAFLKFLSARPELFRLDVIEKCSKLFFDGIAK
jgi:hypothetical protein